MRASGRFSMTRAIVPSSSVSYVTYWYSPGLVFWPFSDTDPPSVFLDCAQYLQFRSGSAPVAPSSGADGAPGPERGGPVPHRERPASPGAGELVRRPELLPGVAGGGAGAPGDRAPGARRAGAVPAGRARHPRGLGGPRARGRVVGGARGAGAPGGADRRPRRGGAARGARRGACGTAFPFRVGAAPGHGAAPAGPARGGGARHPLRGGRGWPPPARRVPPCSFGLGHPRHARSRPRAGARWRVDHRQQARTGAAADAPPRGERMGVRGAELPPQPQGHLPRPPRRREAGDEVGARARGRARR